MTHDEVARLEEILATLGDVMSRLRPREREFVEDLVKRYDEHGASMFLSAKQWSWLESIHDRF